MTGTAPDTIIANTAFWLTPLEPQPAPCPLHPHDGGETRPGCASIRVDWVDGHMFGGEARGTRYVVDRRQCPEWETFSLGRLPKAVSVLNITRKVPLHFRAMYSRLSEDEYVMRGEFLAWWSRP